MALAKFASSAKIQVQEKVKDQNRNLRKHPCGLKQVKIKTNLDPRNETKSILKR